MDAATERLARQAEDLQQQERLVTERREEMDRHLTDMREWYCRKLRELAGVDAQAVARAEATASAESAGDDDAGQPLAEGRGARRARPSILSLTGEVDPADRRLGDLLRSRWGCRSRREDSDCGSWSRTPAAPLASLRQILLASGPASPCTRWR